MNRSRLLSILSITLIAFACKKDTTPFDFDYDYYDLTQGRYIEYEVMEVKHDETAAAPFDHDTSHYFLKTLIGDTVIDLEGRVANRFFRFKKQNIADPWLVSDVWTTVIDDRRAELVEENQRMVKLVFKPTSAKVWDHNAYNIFDEMQCYYRDLQDSRSYNGFDFDSTITVEQDSFISFIDYRRKYEVYAKGVGLVYKYHKDLQINQFDTLNVQNGTEIFYKVIGYGIE
ncbi:MAG: hypothetical protein V4638_10815 [Bacteroidota bacterium]